MYLYIEILKSGLYSVLKYRTEAGRRHLHDIDFESTWHQPPPPPIHPHPLKSTVTMHCIRCSHIIFTVPQYN